MNGAMTELSAKIIRSAKISKKKIIGPNQYLFLKRINCQNSENMEKRERKLILSPILWSASSVMMRLGQQDEEGIVLRTSNWH
jgi:hypothetical protein